MPRPATSVPAPTQPAANGSLAASVLSAIEDAGLRGAAARSLAATIEEMTGSAIAANDKRRTELVDRLLATARRVTESRDLDTVLSAIVDDARLLLGADSGDMLLWDRARDVFRVVAVSGDPVEMQGFEFPIEEGLSSEAIRDLRTVWVDDYGAYAKRCQALDHLRFGAVICAPLLFRGEAIGTLNLHATGERRFGPDDADLLAAFADHGAIAIEHARRYANEVDLGRELAVTNRELTRSLAVQQQLAEQVLLDTGPAGIARVLAGHLGRCVVIQDHIRRVIAGASPDGGDHWRHLVDTTPDPEPLSVAVRVGRDVAGHLLLSAEHELGPIDRALVDIAVTGVALEFAKIRASLEVEGRLRGETMADLLAGTYPNEAAMSMRAARLGLDLSQPHDLLVIGVARDATSGDTTPATDPDIDRQLVGLVREQLASRAPKSTTVPYGGAIVVVLKQRSHADRDVHRLAAELATSLEAVAGKGAVTIAIGDTCDRPDAYAPSFAAARRALDVMLKVGRHGAVVGARELGAYGLLLQASSLDDLEGFARNTLEPIVEHDRTHGSDLVRTLRVYLDEDRVQRRAAARCFIHVNTVVYRINRVEQLLGRSLDDPSAVFDVTLALRVLDILDSGSAQAADAGVSQPKRQP
jgi:sugar diacid utilization regulator